MSDAPKTIGHMWGFTRVSYTRTDLHTAALAERDARIAALEAGLVAERQRWWSPEYPGQTKPKLAVWFRHDSEKGLSGFDTKEERDLFGEGHAGPFLRRVTGNEYPQTDEGHQALAARGGRDE